MIGQTSRQHIKMMKSSGRRRELRTSGISSRRPPDPLDTALNKRMAAATLAAAPRLIFIAGVSSRYHPNRDPILRSDVTLTSSQLRIVTLPLISRQEPNGYKFRRFGGQLPLKNSNLESYFHQLPFKFKLYKQPQKSYNFMTQLPFKVKFKIWFRLLIKL